MSVGTGAQNTLWVGGGVGETVRPFWPRPLIAPRGYAMERLGERFVFGYRKPDGTPVPVVAVNARVDEYDRRDLRLIGDAVWELLDWAAAAGFRTGEQVLEREMVFGDCDRPLSTIAKRFDVPRTGWEIDINPRPRRDSDPNTVEKYWDTDLLSVGVVPGATLRFIAPEPQPAHRR